MAKPKQPPQDLQAEESVLGSILIEPKSIIKIADMLSPEDFFSESNGRLYAAISDLFQDQKPVDLITVSAELKKRKIFDTSGGAARLAELSAAVPSASNVSEYANIVRSSATSRRLVSAGEQIMRLGYETSGDVQNKVEEAEKALFPLSNNILSDQFIQGKDIPP